jgi:hypothetical protein
METLNCRLEANNTDNTRNDPSEADQSQDGTLLTVKDMETRLWQCIDKYDGGIGAVWEQIDSRLKANEEKSIDGLKQKKQNKISYEAFKRAHERMSPEGKKKKSIEKMNYGIRGNPILLMNVFEILGIRGFSDLREANFIKPDSFSKLISIDSKMTDMKSRIEELSDEIEVYCKRKPRISALKLITDIDNITPRLYSIITGNTDPEFDNMEYIMSHTTLGIQALFGKNEEIKPETLGELKKMLAEHKRLFQFCQGLKFADAVFADLFSSFNDEARQVLMMYNIFMEYQEYSSQEPLLRKYYRVLQKIDFRSPRFKHWDEYILSPLYIACFYLQIVIRHLSKIDNKSVKTDEETENKIKLLETGIEPIEYLRRRSSKISNGIRQILGLFDKENIELLNQQYPNYRETLKGIINIYFKIFSENNEFPSSETIHEITLKFANFSQINNSKELGISNCYWLTIDIFNLIETCMNDIETLIRKTKRDLNA